MSIEELEAEALKLKPAARARLAERLLDSLENLSDEENARVWAEEAERRSAAWDADPDSGRPADAVFATAESVASGTAAGHGAREPVPLPFAHIQI